MRDEHAVNGAVRSDRGLINDPVNGISQKFETGNQRNIQFATRKLSAKRGWMIKRDLARPAMNQRPRIEISNAADTKITWLDGVWPYHIYAQASSASLRGSDDVDPLAPLRCR